MSIFGSLGKKVGEAAQTAAKKSGELVEVAKLNMAVSSEESKMQKLYAQIGRKVYESYCNEGDGSADYGDECEQIRVHEENIGILKQKILETRNIKICVDCGAEISAEVSYCPRCGARQP